MTKKIFPLILLLCLLISGCSHSPAVVNEPPVSSTTQTTAGTESAVAELSDQELIILTAESAAIVDWYNGPSLTSSYKPSKIESLFNLSAECTPFDELTKRKSGINSIRRHSSDIIEAYLQDASHNNQLKGVYLAALAKELCPELTKEIDEILSRYETITP